MRVGLGFDNHPFDEASAKPLILGGIVFENEIGLAGHSDGDAVAHACADALLGAAGLGDTGQHFPDTDPRYKDADSLEMLSEVIQKVKDAGFEVMNINCVINCDTPKIAPIRDVMEEKLSTLVGAPVSVGGKRTEGMGLGKPGVTCMAVALLK